MTKETLHGAIEIAAKCEAIDKVRVEPQDSEPSHSYKPEIRVLKIGNWKKRLVKKTVTHLTDNIEFFCDHSHDKPIFRPYIMFNPIIKGIWVYNDMIYDMQAD
jgi:hypothetical protein